MKQEINQQEILLVTTSHFSLRELCERSNNESIYGQMSPVHKLAEACWSGLLHETMPEIIQKTEAGRSLLIWQIQHSANSLQIWLSESTPAIEAELSIDPHRFLNCMFGS